MTKKKKKKKKGLETNVQTKPHTQMFTAAIHISQKIETTQISIHRWLDRQNVDFHTMEYYLAKKEKSSDTCKNTDKY